MNYFSDSKAKSSAEWQYHFKNTIDWKSIVPLYFKEFPTQDGIATEAELLTFFEEVLGSVGKWSADTLMPRSRELDRVGGAHLVDGRVVINEPLEKTYQEGRELGIFQMYGEPAHGGMGLPVAVGMLSFTFISRASPSYSTQIGFFGSMADMLDRFGPKQFQSKYLPKIYAGEVSGCMCLTESNCGSDLGAIKTTAKKQADGTYRLYGTKQFITNAGGGIAYILARIEGAPAGLDGISMFFAELNIEGQPSANFKVTKIEEKMGMHGSPTCEVVFDGSIAHLVGKENEGFRYMLHLMNEARISVGLQSLAGMEGAIAYARDYAEQRKQFGKPLTELPLFARNLADWETEIDAFRSLMVDTMSHFDVFQKLHLKRQHLGELNQMEDAQYHRAAKVVRGRTPLVKYYGTEKYAELTQKAIQALGGYGYMEEYDVGRFHRDCFGALLYEGTSQIQALMAMKDFVKHVMRDPARFFQSIVAASPLVQFGTGSSSQRDLVAVQYDFRKSLVGLLMRCFRPESAVSESSFRETLGQLAKAFKRDYWQEAGRFDRLMAHAETLCQALSYLETLQVLSDQATKDATRLPLFQRYHRLVVPRLAAIFSDWKQAR